MMQRLLDSVLGVAKEAVKTFSRETFNNTIKLVNGVAGVVLAFVPGQANIVEGLRGWELHPTFKAPRLARWMEDGVSSFNQFLYDYVDSESASGSEYDTDEESEGGTGLLPSTPTSRRTSSNHHSGSFKSSRVSERRHGWWSAFKRWFWLLFWPLALFFRHRRSTRHAVRSRRSSGLRSGVASPVSRSSSSGSLSRVYELAGSEFSRKFSDVVEYVTHLNDNRRRGILEDLEVIMELAIEKVFEGVRGILFYTFSPWESLKVIARGMFGRPRRQRQEPGTAVLGTESAAVLGSSDPSPKLLLQQQLNMDARTCEDIVTDAGYPYESIKVTTEDGYVLQVERIPRRTSRKVLYLQHGILDTSLGWVSNGVVGSPAFAAFDQGYDVFLGNLRGYASREHVDKRISARRYWRYSINEHGMQDVPAMIERIHEMKVAELSSLPVSPIFSSEATSTCASASDANGPDGSSSSSPSATDEEAQPYSMSTVSHSLGGAAMLVYIVTRRILGKPHRLSRMILLSPAGFHQQTPFLFDLLMWGVVGPFPFLDSIMTRYIPGFYIPTRGLRLLFNKLAQDFQNLPALRALVQVLMSSLLVGGDSSDWVGSLRQPHYNMFDMPGLAYRVAKHMAQMKHARKFVLYDYRHSSVNMQAYGQPTPLDIGYHYGLINIPVDVVVGGKDRLIPPAMVLKHYEAMKSANVKVSVKEFDYAHLDFTVAHKEELLAYIMARLLLPSNSHKVRRTQSLRNGLDARVQNILERAAERGAVKGSGANAASIPQVKAEGNSLSADGHQTGSGSSRRWNIEHTAGHVNDEDRRANDGVSSSPVEHHSPARFTKKSAPSGNSKKNATAGGKALGFSSSYDDRPGQFATRASQAQEERRQSILTAQRLPSSKRRDHEAGIEGSQLSESSLDSAASAFAAAQEAGAAVNSPAASIGGRGRRTTEFHSSMLNTAELTDDGSVPVKPLQDKLDKCIDSAATNGRRTPKEREATGKAARMMEEMSIPATFRSLSQQHRIGVAGQDIQDVWEHIEHDFHLARS
eukprot:SM000016S01811  [mRNA]  locus=s16:14558:21897:+ [translate_table: standard]